jgi:hypothetical protein
MTKRIKLWLWTASPNGYATTSREVRRTRKRFPAN